MASNGIRDRVAIVGMGCTPFGEHWDKGVNDLLVDSTKDALASAGGNNILPNLLFTLDNSGSMNWDFIPDYVNPATSGMPNNPWAR